MPSELPRKKLKMNPSASVERAGGDEPGDRSGQATSEAIGHRDRQQPAGAGDDEPRQRCAGVAEHARTAS